ncbi:MAG: efflux RND transporter periplasmic adaptor subunit [Candidatus Melainabacteria bacterium]|nr:efflux RND transporter periplasmic adaptor subunit [Candidatus Melainabacteria bacterium]
MFIIALATLTASCNSPQEKTNDASKTTVKDIPIKTELVKERNLNSSLNVAGQIHPEFGKEVTLTNHVPGRIIQIFVSPGQKVHKGQALALVDSRTISTLQSELVESDSKLAIAKAHEEREQQIFNEQLKRPENLIEAQAKFDEARTKAKLTARNLKRYEQLTREKIAATKDLYAAQANYATAQSVFRQAKADLEREERLYKNKAMMKRDLQLAQAEVRSAQQHLNTLRQRLIFHGMTPAQITDVIKTNRINGEIPITSSLDGIISGQYVALGETVDPGKKTFRITDLSVVALTADIPAADLPKINIGTPVIAKIPGYSKKIFKGKINYISSHIDPESRTAQIRARLPNPDLKLRASLFTDTEIQLPQHTVLACPKEAVQRKDDKKVVYISVDGKFKEQPIEVGTSNEEYFEVTKGLSDGDRVVTTGSLLLRAQFESSHAPEVISERGAMQN